MTYDDFRRAMERISKSQERFDERMKRAPKLNKSRTHQLEAAAANFNKAVAECKKAQKVLDVKMSELAKAQARTQRRIDDLKKRVGGQPNAR
ncbi:MAG TPA: hypothetical protein VNZ44_04085 [Pyrinomonadaceae bacterium]|nr:hypothetical protein [Pyrinomonadaceae bacterium]